MTATLTHESQLVALDVYALLKELDPARFTADMDSALRARLKEIETRLSTLVALAANQKSQLATRLADLTAVVKERRPRNREEWTELFGRLQNAYGALAKQLKAADIHVPELRPTNYARNLLHVASAGLALLVAGLVPSPWLQIVAGTLCATVWIMEGLRHYTVGAREKLLHALGVFAHPHEHDRVNSSTWYVNALFLLTLFFDPAIIMASIAVLGLSDPAAALVGRRFGRTRLINGRSLEGSLTFLVVGVVAAGGMLALMTSWSWTLVLAVSAGASLLGAVAELVSRKVDDNFSIPMSAAVGALLVLSLLG